MVARCIEMISSGVDSDISERGELANNKHVQTFLTDYVYESIEL